MTIRRFALFKIHALFQITVRSGEVMVLFNIYMNIAKLAAQQIEREIRFSIQVSECALRCFATLTDRFLRKFMDPVEMVRHGDLVQHLLNSMVPAHLTSGVCTTSLSHMRNANSVGTNDSMTAALTFGLNRPASFTSVVISLLSNLCRGSTIVTEQVVR